MQNVLYYGDNLDILRRYIKDESVDLIYLDPPLRALKIITSCSKCVMVRGQRHRSVRLKILGYGTNPQQERFQDHEKKCANANIADHRPITLVSTAIRLESSTAGGPRTSNTS